MFITRVVTAALAVSLLACKGSKSGESAESSGDEELTPEEARTIMGGLFANEMCKPDGYFASCGRFEDGECEKITVASFQTCMDKNPEWIEKLEDESIAEQLAVCTAKGTLLSVAGEGRLSMEGRCSDPEQFP